MSAYARCSTRWSGSASEAAESSDGAADWNGEQEITVLFEHACPGAASLDAGEMWLRRLSTRLWLPRRLLHEPPPPLPAAAATPVARQQPTEPGTLRLVLHDATVPLDTFSAALQGWAGGGDRTSGDPRGAAERQELADELTSRRWQELLSLSAVVLATAHYTACCWLWLLATAHCLLLTVHC